MIIQDTIMVQEGRFGSPELLIRAVCTDAHEINMVRRASMSGRGIRIEQVRGAWATSTPPNALKYSFVVPDKNMVDLDRIREDLSMKKPLAIIKWGGINTFVVHEPLVEKGDIIGKPLRFSRGGDFLTGEVVKRVREVVHAPWPDSFRREKVDVTIVDI